MATHYRFSSPLNTQAALSEFLEKLPKSIQTTQSTPPAANGEERTSHEIHIADASGREIAILYAKVNSNTPYVQLTDIADSEHKDSIQKAFDECCGRNEPISNSHVVSSTPAPLGNTR